MEKVLFKNIELLASPRDIKLLEQYLSDPAHHAINIDLGKALETDANGRIVFFIPTEGMKWSLVFYLQNLMIRQRLEEIDLFLDQNRNRK